MFFHHHIIDYNKVMFEISAGAIVYTFDNMKVRYLVIKDFHGNYGFPKGHLEKDETLLQAAYREIKEETGIDVTIDPAFKETLIYTMPNGKEKRSVYFLATYQDQEIKKQEEEVDEAFLLSFEEAMNILTFENMAKVLKKADKYIRRNVL